MWKHLAGQHNSAMNIFRLGLYVFWHLIVKQGPFPGKSLVHCIKWYISTCFSFLSNKYFHMCSLKIFWCLWLLFICFRNVYIIFIRLYIITYSSVRDSWIKINRLILVTFIFFFSWVLLGSFKLQENCSNCTH